MAVGLLWAALSLVLRGTGRAEWTARAERGLEAFARVLEDELRRANHLVTTSPGGALHAPRFSAVWVLEDGGVLRFRVFEPDQAVADPARLPLEELLQDRIAFLAREGRLVYMRRGDLEEEDTRVLLEDLAEVNFSPGSPYEDRGLLGGLLRVRVVLRQSRGEARMEREMTLPVGVPVVIVGETPQGVELLPPPQAGEAPERGAGPGT
jgi:hypothetical protein